MSNTKHIIDNCNKHILTTSIQTNIPPPLTKKATRLRSGTVDKRTLVRSMELPAIICNLPRHCYKDNNKMETYIGLTENDFETRYRNHTASSRQAKHRNSTEHGNHMWTLKDKNIELFFSWRILSSHSLFNSSSKRCNLLLGGGVILPEKGFPMSSFPFMNVIVSSFSNEVKELNLLKLACSILKCLHILQRLKL